MTRDVAKHFETLLLTPTAELVPSHSCCREVAFSIIVLRAGRLERCNFWVHDMYFKNFDATHPLFKVPFPHAMLCISNQR